MEKIKIKVKRVSDRFNDIPLPDYATPGSAGMDVRAAIDEPVTLKPGQIELIPTNLSVEIPSEYEIQVRPRSGLAAKHGIGLVNAPGTIDSDFRGEIKIILINFGKEDFTINRGDRIAQLIFNKVFYAKFVEVEELNNSQRGEGGFGHTGKH
jgi:dUTP pyrophosphatase